MANSRTNTVTIKEQTFEVLTRPYTIEEMQEEADDNNLVSGIVAVEISDLLDKNFEEGMDLLSEALTDSDLLMEINYDFLAIEGGHSVKRTKGKDCHDFVAIFLFLQNGSKNRNDFCSAFISFFMQSQN